MWSLHALLTGYSKFVIGVNVNVDGCLSLCISPATNWGPALVAGQVPRPPPLTLRQLGLSLTFKLLTTL